MFLSFLFSVLSVYTGAPTIFDLTARDEQVCMESCKGQTKRTLFGIVWSCILTVIICAWTAVHPNVPPRGKWHALWNRLLLMFWMIVTPELVLAWAVRQLFAAKDIRDAYNHSRESKKIQKFGDGTKLVANIQIGIIGNTRRWIRWTLVQGHLLGMGGFTLIDPELKGADSQDQNGRVLTNNKFEELIRNPEFEFPDVTEADIQDRSKGDVLFKVIAILQTTWFIIQCIARGQRRLGLTELELVTLALASLNAVTFAIWWHKPLGVREPVRIYLRIETREIQIDDASQWVDGRLSFRDILSKGWKDVKSATSDIVDFVLNPCEEGLIYVLLALFVFVPVVLFYIVTFPIFVLFPLGIVLLLQIIETEPATQNPTQSRGLLAARIVAFLQTFRYSLSSAVTRFVGTRLNKIFHENIQVPIVTFFFDWCFLLPFLFIFLFLVVIFLTPFLTILFLVSFIFTSVFGIVTTSNVRSGAPHVPSFYAPTTKSDRWSRMVVFALFGAIFGSIHCIGWYFNYPTNVERTLWRATSLTITVIPLIIAPIDFLLTTRLRTHNINSCSRFERIVLLILDLFMTILLFVYVPVRLSLIVQALVLLRKQPLNAFVALDWTKYIPHLFSQ